MALRVLLADESSTIKKAFQLALSDYAVEVKSVPSGIDVLTVALDFDPDIVFADILLAKKNGYDVSQELKSHPSFSNTPVILMWSSFMEFDEKLSQKAQADGRLEKPFDSESLRQIINKFVPKTKKHPLNGLLTFPPLPDFEESPTFVRQKQEQKNGKPADKTNFVDNSATPEKSEEFSFQKSSLLQQIPDVDDGSSDDDQLEDFKPVTLQAKELASLKPALSGLDDVDKRNKAVDSKMYQKKMDAEENLFSDLNLNFKKNNSNSGFTNQANSSDSKNEPDYDIHIETENYGEFEEVLLVKTDENENELENKIQDQLKNYLQNSPVALNKKQNEHLSSLHKKLTAFEEQLLREEVRMMAEKICWQVIPDITEKIVREELNKLLQNIEKSI